MVSKSPDSPPLRRLAPPPLRALAPADVTSPARGVAIAGFIWTLVRTDFKTRYHGALSGFVWALAKPATMFVVLVAVFSFVFRSEPTYKLDLVIGLFLYDFFTDATKTGMTSLAVKSFLLSKARLPSWVVVIASMANAVLTLLVFATVVVLFLVASGRTPSWPVVVAFAGYLFALVLIATGISLGTAVLFLRYRDLNQVWDMATHAGFFVAPIIYPLGVIPERFHAWLYLWPPTPVMEFARMALVDGMLPTARGHASLAVLVALVVGAGALLFRRHAPRAAEYL